MKIALFSDIHANLPAFEAMLQDMDSREPDAVYCLGDMIGYNVWPNEVIAEIRKRGIATLAGNHDVKIADLVTTADQLKEGGKNYAYHIVSDDNRYYLTSLPAHIRLEYKLAESPLNIMFAHGSLRSIDEYVLADLDEAYILAMMNEANADVLCVGHSHKPFHRALQASDGKFKHIINIGSVGKPKDKNPMGCYVLLNISKSSSTADRDSLKVDFVRFAYDTEKAAMAIESSPLPNEFADMLRNGY